MHWINNVLMIQPHALFQLKGEKISDLSHCLNWLYLSASCKVIQDSLGFWIPRHGFRIPATGFRVLCQWNLDSRYQSLVGFQIPGAVFWIPKPRILDYTSKFSLILDFKNPHSLTWAIPYLTQRERWRPRHKKTSTGSWYFLSCALTPDSKNSYSGSWNKALRLVVQDGRVPSSEISNFRLLFMTSGAPAFPLLKLAIRNL